MAPAKTAKKGVQKTKKTTAKFSIKCSGPVSDEIFDISAFEKFLTDRIKVEGKTGRVGSVVTLNRDARTHEIRVAAKVPFSKRALKYYTKKFLKKQQLRDYIRVVADSKGSYQLKYFNVANEEEEQ